MFTVLYCCIRCWGDDNFHFTRSQQWLAEEILVWMHPGWGWFVLLKPHRSSREAAWRVNWRNHCSEWPPLSPGWSCWWEHVASQQLIPHKTIPWSKLVRVRILEHLVLPLLGTHRKVWHSWNSGSCGHYNQEFYRHFQGNWERLNTESLSVSKK